MEITLENIVKKFEDAKALDNVALNIKDRELMAILGPSGSGKTTLIRIVAGLTPPDRGRILFDGKDVTDMSPEKRGVGMVFQNYALFPHMNVEENIGFGLVVRGKKMGEIKKRVKELLNLMGLEGYEKRMMNELSGGEMQRVALARALAPGVGILLLDEPLSALDAKLRDSLRGEIKRIHRELGITTVYVTHDQKEALSVSDRVAVMNRGRIEQVGTPNDIYSMPETEFVARFVGEGNILKGKVIEGYVHTPIGKIPAKGISDGERVKILIRPENIMLEPAENSLNIKGRIVEVESAGGELRGRVSAGDVDLIFRRYADEVNVDTGDDIEMFIPLGSISFIGKMRKRHEIE